MEARSNTLQAHACLSNCVRENRKSFQKTDRKSTQEENARGPELPHAGAFFGSVSSEPEPFSGFFLKKNPPRKPFCGSTEIRKMPYISPGGTMPAGFRGFPLGEPLTTAPCCFPSRQSISDALQACRTVTKSTAKPPGGRLMRCTL